jgi:hypothetical protein
MPITWGWDNSAGDRTNRTMDPIDHVEFYLNMLAGFLVQAGINVHRPRSQVSGPEVPGHRLVNANVDPKIRAENAQVLENAFAQFSWLTVVNDGEFMQGTKFLMMDPAVMGTQVWEVCDRPEVFMAPGALGLTDKNATWWAVSNGDRCPVLCFVCECCSWWWW